MKRKNNNKKGGVRNQALPLEKAVYLYVMCIDACKTSVFLPLLKKCLHGTCCLHKDLLAYEEDNYLTQYTDLFCAL